LFSSNGDVGFGRTGLGARERLREQAALVQAGSNEFGNSYNSHFDFLHRHFNHGCRAGIGAATKCTRTGVIEIMSVAARW
jgi:hypothetical protein